MYLNLSSDGDFLFIYKRRGGCSLLWLNECYFLFYVLKSVLASIEKVCVALLAGMSFAGKLLLNLHHYHLI